MPVCSYYLRGACKYGDQCRNEHPVTSRTFSNQTWSSSNSRVAVPYTVESMTADVTPFKDKPLWPLSSYGPSKHEPVVISGLDESPEELRLKAVTALKAGTTDEYAKYEGGRTVAANQMYTDARNNVRQLYEQVVKISTQALASTSAAGSSVPAMMTSAPSAFGTSPVPSAFGGTTATAFGKSAFGQPTPVQTDFGGSTGTSAFGQAVQGTSAFGQTTQPTSVFGQPTQSGSVFGQPSAFGATAQPTSVFGKPSQPTSVFGQPTGPVSAFGQPSQPTSPFTQPAQSVSAFSQPSHPAFGQSSLIKPASGAFGGVGGGGFSAFTSQPSAFAPTAAPSSLAPGITQSAFGSAPSVQSAFATALSSPKSAFGTSQPSPFGTSVFAPPLAAPVTLSPASSVGGSPFIASPMTVTPSTEKPTSSAPDFATAKMAARMKPGADRYLSLLPSDYNELIPADVKAAFTSARFEWGKIPDWIPPEEVR